MNSNVPPEAATVACVANVCTKDRSREFASILGFANDCRVLYSRSPSITMRMVAELRRTYERPSRLGAE